MILFFCFNLCGCATFSRFVWKGTLSQEFPRRCFDMLFSFAWWKEEKDGKRWCVLPVLCIKLLLSALGTSNVWLGGNGEHLGLSQAEMSGFHIGYFEHCPISCKSVSVLLKCRVNTTSAYTHLYLCAESKFSAIKKEANWPKNLVHLKLWTAILDVLQNYFV